MDLRSIIKVLDNKIIPITEAKLNTARHILKNIRNMSILQMREWGYFEDNNYSTKELIIIFSQEHSYEIDNLFNGATGELDLSPTRILLAKLKTEDSEFKNVLSELYKYTKSTLLLSEMDKLKVKNDNLIMKYYINRSGYVHTENTFFDNYEEAFNFIDLLGVEDMDLYIQDFSSLMYATFLESIGIEKETIVEAKNTNIGLLLKGLTFKEETLVLELITEGTILCDTKYKKLYNSYKYKTVGKSHKTVSYLQVYLDMLQEYLNTRLNNEEDIYFLNSKYIIFHRVKDLPKTAKPIVIKKKYYQGLDRFWENTGVYTLNWDTGKHLHPVNSIMGYAGEYISKDFIRRFGAELNINLLGIPKNCREVRLYNFKDINKFEYSTSLMYDVRDLGVQSKLGQCVDFEYISVEPYLSILKELLRCTNNSQIALFLALKKSFHYVEFAEYKNSEEFKILLADLILCILYTRCGKPYYSLYPLDDRLNLVYAKDFDMLIKASYSAYKYLIQNGILKK